METNNKKILVESSNRMLVESLTKFISKDKSVKIRIWREEKSLTHGNNQDLLLFITKYLKKYIIWYPEKLAAAILELSRVNAVEILDKNDCGVVLYKEWP